MQSQISIEKKSLPLTNPKDRVLLLDLDKTVVDEAYNYNSPWDRDLILSLRSKGWSIGLNSDTPLDTLKIWSARLEIDGPIIAERGGIVRIGDEIFNVNQKAIEESRRYMQNVEKFLYLNSITVWKEGNPVEVIREGKMAGSDGWRFAFRLSGGRYSCSLRGQ